MVRWALAPVSLYRHTMRIRRLPCQHCNTDQPLTSPCILIHWLGYDLQQVVRTFWFRLQSTLALTDRWSLAVQGTVGTSWHRGRAVRTDRRICKKMQIKTGSGWLHRTLHKINRFLSACNATEVWSWIWHHSESIGFYPSWPVDTSNVLMKLGVDMKSQTIVLKTIISNMPTRRPFWIWHD